MKIRIAACIAALNCLAVAQSVNYTYDDAGRLALADFGNGQTIAYTYDKAGNLLSRTVTSGNPPASPNAKTVKKPKGVDKGPATSTKK